MTTLPPYIAEGGRAGAVDPLDPAGLTGWALDLDAPGTIPRVILRAAGRGLAETAADRDRPDLDAATGLPTPRGFLFAWPDLADALSAADPDAMPEIVLADSGDLLPWLGEPPTLARLRDLAAGKADGTNSAPSADAGDDLDAFLRDRAAPVILRIPVETPPPSVPVPDVIAPPAPGITVVVSTPPAPEVRPASPRPPRPAPPARRPAPRPVARSAPAALDRPSRDLPAATRALEAAIAARDTPVAAARAAELEADPAARRDPTAALALSRHHHAAGNPTRAAWVLRDLPPYPATDLGTELAILHRLIEEDALDAAAARLAAASDGEGGEEPPEFHGPRLRLAARVGDTARFGALLDDPRAAPLPDWQLVEATFRLTKPGRAPVGAERRVLDRLEGLVRARGLDDPGIVRARLHVLMHGRRWEEVAALFDALDGGPIAGLRDIQLRRLEYLAQSGQAEEADRFYRDHLRDVPLEPGQVLPILRLLSEAGHWEDAAAVLLDHVRRGEGLGEAAHIALRIVRKAGLHDAVLRAAGTRGRAEAGAEDFVAMVAEDLALRRRDAPISGAAPIRNTWVLRGAAGPDPLAEEFCTYVCANRRYFLSALTFLASFLGQSPQVGGRVVVFLDDDVPRTWHGALLMLAARFDRALDIVTEPDFVPADVEHREGYGFFAAGRVLSRAAYFRLYAARYLTERHGFRRIAYLDTDTICRGDLSGLFALDLGNALLAAATDDQTLDVAIAEARHGLDPGAYFNSGVLLLRADDPAMHDAMAEAIRVSEEEPERLFFHDQCALNIAFRNRVAPLPRRYNHFMIPTREANGRLEDAVILHFLDRPKPWDFAFDRGYREEWRVWALLVGSIIPHGLHLDIAAAANDE